MKDLLTAPKKIFSRYRWILLLVLLLVSTTSLVIEFYQATAGDEYFVAHEDEVIYYGSAKVFAETGSLQAESCIEEDVSRFGKLNWYGPGYNVVYGSLIKFFGLTNSRFIQFHLLLTLASLAIVLLLPGKWESNLLAANVFLFTQQFTSYIFSYFPETLHFFLAVVLTSILIHLFQRRESGKPIQNLVTIYVLLVVLFSLCRITTIFWLAALVPLSKGRKDFIIYTSVFVIGVVVSLLYLKLFIAPPFARSMHKIDLLYSLDLFHFVLQTTFALLKNGYNLLWVNSVPAYLLFGLGALAIFQCWRTKDRLVMAAVLVGFFLTMALLAYYSIDPFYFVKQTAVLLPLLMIVLMRQSHMAIQYLIFVAFIFFWVGNNKERTWNIEEHKRAYINRTNSQGFESALNELRYKIEDKPGLVILWCYSEYDYGHAAQALLPYSTPSGKPIMYTTNIAFDPSTPLDVKFKLHNKLKVDYLLSRYPIPWPNLEELFVTDYFHFYRIIH